MILKSGRFSCILYKLLEFEPNKIIIYGRYGIFLGGNIEKNE
jgi:hypothetical protein